MSGKDIRRNSACKNTKNSTDKKKYLTDSQVKELMYAAESRGRHQHRDMVLILMMYRHGLRACEAISLTWDDINFKESNIYIWRAKNGNSTTHILQPDEVEALTELKRLYPSDSYVFTGEKTPQLSRESLGRIIKTAAKLAGLKDVHPHTLRHSCGFNLAEKGMNMYDIQAYLGHVNVQNTAIYIAGNPKRFENIDWN